MSPSNRALYDTSIGLVIIITLWNVLIILSFLHRLVMLPVPMEPLSMPLVSQRGPSLYIEYMLPLFQSPYVVMLLFEGSWYIEEEELKSKKTIVHCCRILLILESASFCPLDHFVFFLSLPLLVILLSRDGGLRWWRPRWRTRFLRFTDVSKEVSTCVISDLINRNIFSYPTIYIWMNIESMEMFNFLYIIDYIC